jgi:hypothetical protein
MNVIIIILLVVAAIIALLLTIALFMKKEHYVKREIIINAPRQKVFDFVKLLKNQDEFNKHAMAAPDRKREFRGTDGTVGYTMRGAEIKMLVWEKRKLRTSLKGKELKWKFVL